MLLNREEELINKKLKRKSLKLFPILAKRATKCMLAITLSSKFIFLIFFIFIFFLNLTYLYIFFNPHLYSF